MKVFNLLKDFLIKKEIYYIQEESSFESALIDIESNNLLAFDTEFIWRNTYFPKLSLIQVCTENRIYILDCLALDMSKIHKVLADKNVTKIFHSVRGDSSVLYNCLNIKLENIFDTQLAEGILNQTKGVQISYKKIVKKYFLKDISKSETNSDWESRPLRNTQIKYAAEDVRYLHSIMRIQNKKLKRLNKLNLFHLQCEKEKNLGEEDFSESRLKRLLKKNKNASQLEIDIFNWRESQARKMDVPPSHILQDRDLKHLKKIVEKKKFDECRWIIKKDSSRNDFMKDFL